MRFWQDDIILGLELEISWINYNLNWTFYTRLAEGGQTDNISSCWSNAWSRRNINGARSNPCSRIFHFTLDRTLRSNLAFFSFPPVRFTLAASVVKNSFQRVDWAYFFVCKALLVLFFGQNTKSWATSIFSFQYCSSKGLGNINIGSRLSEKNVTQLTELLLRTKVISPPLSKFSESFRCRCHMWGRWSRDSGFLYVYNTRNSVRLCDMRYNYGKSRPL